MSNVPGRVDESVLKAHVIVCGAGPTGLGAAIASARAGFEVIVAGSIEQRATGRTLALLDGSVRFFKALAIWELLAPFSAPIETMRLVDDTGSLFRGRPVDFKAREIGLVAFGHNIENRHLIAVLAKIARETQGIRIHEKRAARFFCGPGVVSAQLEDGTVIEAPLLVAADGRQSAARVSANIPVREWTYPQMALTAILAHKRPHRETSTEFHTRDGPFTLVPLPPGPTAPNRSSLVWLMAPKEARRRLLLDSNELAAEIERQAQSILGPMTLEDRPGSFPMSGMAARHLTGHRLALAGEAGHVLPPIGAQGFNLALRDVAQLVECIEAARRRDQDIGSAAVLSDYEQRRRFDISLRMAGVDGLNRSLLSTLMPIDFLRGAGLMALSAIAPLRRALMREGIMPQRGTPRMMRGDTRPDPH